jgi:hypothetical protein
VQALSCGDGHHLAMDRRDGWGRLLEGQGFHDLRER